jgi:hypothetical protein
VYRVIRLVRPPLCTQKPKIVEKPRGRGCAKWIVTIFCKWAKNFFPKIF